MFHSPGTTLTRNDLSLCCQPPIIPLRGARSAGTLKTRAKRNGVFHYKMVIYGWAREETTTVG